MAHESCAGCGPVRGSAGAFGSSTTGPPQTRRSMMLYAYAKNTQGDLTPAQARVVGQLIREEFQ